MPNSGLQLKTGECLSPYAIENPGMRPGWARPIQTDKETLSRLASDEVDVDDNVRKIL
jgi:hypothetical protein